MQKKHKKIEGQFDSTIPPSAYIAIMVLCTPSLHKCSVKVSFVCWYMNVWKKNMQRLAVVAGTFYQEMWSNRDNHRYCNNRTKMAVCTVVVSNFFFLVNNLKPCLKKKRVSHIHEKVYVPQTIQCSLKQLPSVQLCVLESLQQGAKYLKATL